MAVVIFVIESFPIVITVFMVRKALGKLNISVPKAKGGTDHLNNLFPACIPCNLEKGVRHTKTVRKRNGVTRAPYNKAKKDKIKSNNMFALSILGFALGNGVGGPLGGIILGVLGSEIGRKISLKR